jgi:hypothetical protein
VTRQHLDDVLLPPQRRTRLVGRLELDRVARFDPAVRPHINDHARAVTQPHEEVRSMPNPALPNDQLNQNGSDATATTSASASKTIS